MHESAAESLAIHVNSSEVLLWKHKFRLLSVKITFHWLMKHMCSIKLIPQSDHSIITNTIWQVDVIKRYKTYSYKAIEDSNFCHILNSTFSFVKILDEIGPFVNKVLYFRCFLWRWEGVEFGLGEMFEQRDSSFEWSRVCLYISGWAFDSEASWEGLGFWNWPS